MLKYVATLSTGAGRKAKKLLKAGSYAKMKKIGKYMNVGLRKSEKSTSF